jgi:FMN phosphatase YigB (HAD superfamily)
MTQTPYRFDAVLFDFADTLFNSRSALLPDLMARRCEEIGLPASEDDCRAWIEQIIACAAREDGRARMRSCDYSPLLHRASWTACVHACPDIPAAFADPFYEVFCNATLWRPFQDALPVLRMLSARGIAVAVVSNIGWNIRPAIDASHMGCFVEAVVQSFELGALKPEPAPFRSALEQLGIAPGRALMVGDNWSTDGGAQALGVTTLLLPQAGDPSLPRGLEMVLDLLGIARRQNEAMNVAAPAGSSAAFA